MADDKKIIFSMVGVSKTYASNNKQVLKDIYLSFYYGAKIGILGLNGAGKSTTMNIICGVLNQTEGDVYINGINKKENPRLAKRQLGFLPQTPPLYADFTVNEFLTYAADLRFIDKMQVK